MDWIKLNTQVKVHSPIITQNYYAPLTSQVDTLEKVNIIHLYLTANNNKAASGTGLPGSGRQSTKYDSRSQPAMPTRTAQNGGGNVKSHQRATCE